MVEKMVFVGTEIERLYVAVRGRIFTIQKLLESYEDLGEGSSKTYMQNKLEEELDDLKKLEKRFEEARRIAA